MNEAAFDLPEVKFSDQSVTYLETSAGPDARAAILVERNPIEPQRSLRDVASAHVNDARKRLRGYEILEQSERDLAGVPAIEVRSKWRDDDGMVYTRSVHVLLGDMHMVISTEGALESRPVCDATFDQVIETFRFRG